MIGRPDAPALPGSTIPRSRWRWTASRREAAWGWLFVSPWIVGFVLFTAIPMALALYFSLTDFDLRRPDEVHFVGLANYAQLLRDPNVLQSLGVTLRFAIITVPPTIALAVGLAVLLNSPRLSGRRGFRTLFYMPTQIPLVASTLIWAGVLNAETGWVNGLLGFVGVSGPDWLERPGLGAAVARHRRAVGDRRDDADRPGRASRASRPSCTTPPRSMAPAPGRRSGGSRCRF